MYDPSSVSAIDPPAWWDFEGENVTDRAGRFGHSAMTDGVKLAGIVLDGMEFRLGSFRKADLTGARLRSARFLQVDFSRAKLGKVKATGVNFKNSDLTKADLREADLLDGIAETGSIAAAGRRMGMSHKRAWLLVDTMNRCFRCPLVETSRGGSSKGGALLTDTGREVLERYLERAEPRCRSAPTGSRSRRCRCRQPRWRAAGSSSFRR